MTATKTGGFLFGRPSYDSRGRDAVWVTAAMRAATDREPRSFAFDYEALRAHQAENGRARIVGDWHTHPSVASVVKRSP
jgi:Prokaryotic homologs of the JAB domain